MKYIIDKQYFDNVVEHQRVKMLQDFDTNANGDISIDVNFKSYRVNDAEPKFDTSVQAISMFSGAGGLDIGAQLANVKVLSSLDFFEDSVKTIGLNKCFSESVHMNRDIKTVTAQDYREIIRKNNPEKMIIIGGPPCQPFSKAGLRWAKRKASPIPPGCWVVCLTASNTVALARRSWKTSAITPVFLCGMASPMSSIPPRFWQTS